MDKISRFGNAGILAGIGSGGQEAPHKDSGIGIGQR